MTDRTQHDRDTIVAELVGEALERRDETGGVDLAELCSEHPDVIEDVRQALDVASKLPGLQTAGVGVDRVVGSVFADRYRIEERVGAGAMGVVYGATDLDLGRPVAIKVLHLGLLDATEAAARFEREASALAAIEHESVVTIHDRGTTEDGSPFLVMERIDGVSLSHVLDEARSLKDLRDDTGWLKERLGINDLEEPSFLRQSVRWAASLASGLSAAHRAGVYHRDVKPSNVMIRRDGRAVLLDFGIAAKDDHATLTRSDAAVGTPAYMAPEALAGRAKARPSQDVYGLSATLYHLLTLRAPYQGSPSEVLTALATREPVPAFRVRPGLPRDAQAILDAGLARKATDRYSSADALENDLRSFLAYRPVSVRPVSTMARGWRKLRRSKTLSGAAATLLVVLGYTAFSSLAQSASKSRGLTFHEAWSHVPANFTLVEPELRVIRNERLRGEVADVLRRVVDARHEFVAPRAIRASFRLDHGDVSGASSDMEAIANRVRTPLTRALAARYAAVAEGSRGIGAVDLTDLPEPKSVEGTYLMAYHALRVRDFGAAQALLETEGLESIRHAAELRLSFEAAGLDRMRGDERMINAGRTYTAIIAAEQGLGGRSAMTAHWAGYALAAQQRYHESIPLCREALALAPCSHVSMTNLAHDAYRLGRLDESRAMSELSIEMHPTYLKPHLKLVDIAIDERNFDRAQTILRSAPFPATPEGEEARRSQLGLAEAHRAIWHFSGGRSEPASEAATAAIGLYSEITAPTWEDRWNVAACERIREDDAKGLLLLLVEWQLDDPLDHFDLRLLIESLPVTLDTESTQAVRALLQSITDTLAARALIGFEPR